MKNTKFFWVIVILLMITIGISGCTSQKSVGGQDEINDGSGNGGGNGGTTQLPNPAAVYCERDRGGVHQSVDTDIGSKGYCSLPDGRVCEAWPFFNSTGETCIPYEGA
jgi:putative hemolysin